MPNPGALLLKRIRNQFRHATPTAFILQLRYGVRERGTLTRVSRFPAGAALTHQLAASMEVVRERR